LVAALCALFLFVCLRDREQQRRESDCNGAGVRSGIDDDDNMIMNVLAAAMLSNGGVAGLMPMMMISLPLRNT